jgi:predicted HNH restriction endonuclease
MIPSEDRITRSLLKQLYSYESLSAPNDEIYNELAIQFETELDVSDLERYHNSRSKWANRIQVTRNHLIKKGLILSPSENKRGEWKLSYEGIKVARDYYIEDYEYDPWENDTITIDNIKEEVVAKFQPQDEEITFPEGKLKYALHIKKERNSKLIALKKKLSFDKNSLLPCEICGLSFVETYGEVGEGFIEAHHIFPISELNEETETKITDLILLCANCHKMIHRKRPWLTVEQIKQLLAVVGMSGR